jgi:hypothetical protein
MQLAPVTVDCVDECSDPERYADEENLIWLIAIR